MTCTGNFYFRLCCQEENACVYNYHCCDKAKWREFCWGFYLLTGTTYSKLGINAAETKTRNFHFQELSGAVIAVQTCIKINVSKNLISCSFVPSAKGQTEDENFQRLDRQNKYLQRRMNVKNDFYFGEMMEWKTA